MKKRSMVSRLVALLSTLAIASMFWGCGQDTITGVDQREAPLQTAEDGGPPADGSTDGWW